MVRKIKKRSPKSRKVSNNDVPQLRRRFHFSDEFWLLIVSLLIGCTAIITSVSFLVKCFIKMFGGF